MIMDVPLEVTVELGRTSKNISDILEFAPGTIIELDKIAGEPIDVLVNGKCINIPSYLIKAGDVIEIREKSKSLQRYKDIVEVTEGRLVPEWLDVDQLAGPLAILLLRLQAEEATHVEVLVANYGCEPSAVADVDGQTIRRFILDSIKAIEVWTDALPGLTVLSSTGAYSSMHSS